MARRLVTIEGDIINHVADGQGAQALCGRNPFPYLWSHGEPDRALCVSCAQAMSRGA